MRSVSKILRAIVWCVRGVRAWLLAMRARPVTACCFIGAIFILVLCYISLDHDFRHETNWNIDTPWRATFSRGSLRAMCYLNIPFQDLREDGWCVGWDWFRLYYSGTYCTPDAIPMHGVNYQLELPLWLIGLLMLFASGALLARSAYLFRNRPARCCPLCGYDLTGNISGQCPECGAAIGDHDGSRPKLWTGRRWFRVVRYAVLMPLIALALTMLLDYTVIPAIVTEKAVVILEQPYWAPYSRITISFGSHGWYLPGIHKADSAWQMCDIWINDDDRNSFRVYLDDMSLYTLNDQRRDVSPQSLLNRLAESGFDLTVDGAAAAGDMVFQIILQAVDPRRPFAKRGSFQVNGGMSTSWGNEVFTNEAFAEAGIDASAFETAGASYSTRCGRIALVHELFVFFFAALWLYGIVRILGTRMPQAAS